MIVESVMKQPVWFDFLKEINAGAITPPKSREDQTGIAGNSVLLDNSCSAGCIQDHLLVPQP